MVYEEVSPSRRAFEAAQYEQHLRDTARYQRQCHARAERLANGPGLLAYLVGAFVLWAMIWGGVRIGASIGRCIGNDNVAVITGFGAAVAFVVMLWRLKRFAGAC